MTMDREGTPPFRQILRAYRQRATLSQNALARRAALDPAYICRLESGRQSAPSRHTVHALTAALALSPHDRALVFQAAGYLPPTNGQP